MANNFYTCLAFTLQQEGEWSDDPRDPGGATMEGVTLATYREFKQDSSLTADDLRGISSDEIAAIYQKDYWTAVHGDELPPGVDLSVFDMDVNAGHNSIKLLQAALGVDVDGDVGPQTLGKAAAADPVQLINSLAIHQGNYYRSLRTFPEFGKGWLSRVSARQAAALKLASNDTPDNVPAETVAARTQEAPPDNFWNL